MVLPLLIGVGLAVVAFGARPAANAFKKLLNRPMSPARFKGGFSDPMTKNEAALILGLRATATPDKIKAAHRKLMALNHPDRGGSSHLATKVNEAKQFLLKDKQ